MITKQKKQEIIKDLVDNLSKSTFLTMVDFSGLNVFKMSELRKSLRAIGAEMKVAKKTLIDLAFDKSGIKNFKTKELPGEMALVFDYSGNEIEPAKILRRFSLKNEALKILGGILNKEPINKDQVIFLAKLSSKEEVLARFVGTLNAPVAGFANVLAGNLRGLVCVLSKIHPVK